MLRLRISLSLVILLLAALPASAQYNEKRPRTLDEMVPGASAAFNKEVSETTAEVLKYSDADGDGKLTFPESKNARTKVIDLMTDRMPRAGYIAGGELTVERMRRKITQSSFDLNRDGEIDAKELDRFIAFAIAERERAVRTSHDVQFRLTMEEAEKKIDLSNFRREAEEIKAANWKWKRRSEQQQKENWLEIQARKRAMRAESDAEISESRYETEQLWKAREEAKKGAEATEQSPQPLPE